MKFLFIIVAIVLTGCGRTPEDLLLSFFEEKISFPLKITKTLKSNPQYPLGNKPQCFSVFAFMAKIDFITFQQTSTEFMAWFPVSDGMTFDIGHITLTAPTDLKGIYSIGKNKNGVFKVIIWDEQTETIIFMVSSGVM